MATGVPTGLSSATPGIHRARGEIGDNNDQSPDVHLFQVQADAGTFTYHPKHGSGSGRPPSCVVIKTPKPRRPLIPPSLRAITGAILALAAVLGCPDTARSQMQPQPVWVATNGTAAARVMSPDTSGNVIVAGYDAGDYVTTKFAPDGNLLWSARQTGRPGEWVTPPGVNSIALDDAGNVYVTGGLGGTRAFNTTICVPFFGGCTTYRVVASDMVTIKYDRNGQRQWVATYSERGDVSFIGNAIAVDPAGNVYVGGSATIKYDANGNQLWIRTDLSATAVHLDSMTNLCLTGYSGTRKLDRDGHEFWAAPIYGYYGSTLQLDRAGDLYVNTDTSTIKLDRNGTVVWTAPFTGRLVLDNAGSLYVAGRNEPGRPSPVKLNCRAGTPIWQALDANNASFSSAAADDVGNLYVAGTYSFDSGFFRKYDADGVRSWHAPNSGSLLALDSSGAIYVASGPMLTRFQEVVAPGAPVITGPLMHPLVRVGENVTLSVNARGAPPLSFLWQSTPAWPNPGQTNAVMTLANVTTNRAGIYWVEVVNQLGSAASPGIFVSVLSPLPSQTVVQGGTATFRVPLTAAGPAAYQWQFNGANLPGENGAMLRIADAGPAQAGSYTVVVSNDHGNVLTSTVARLEIDARVTQAWAALTPGGNVGDVGQALGVDGTGNVFVAGYSACGHKTVKYNSAGQKLWEACDGNFGTLGGLIVDSAGSVCIAGSQNTANAGLDIVTIKYASTGSLLWTARFDGASGSNDTASAIVVDNAGNFYVAGNSVGGTNNYDLLTIKYSPGGQQLWAARYDGAAHAEDFATDIKVDSLGNVVVCGASMGPVDYGFLVLKYSPNGSLIWERTHHGPAPGPDFAAHLAVDGTGAIYVTGWSLGEHNTDFATIKYDSEGTLLWVSRYNGPGNDEDNPHGLAVDAAGHVYVTGSSVGTGSPSRLYDIATVKYAPDGTQLWVRRYNGPANLSDYSRAMALDAAGNIYVEGHSQTGPDPNATTEVVTLSYDSAGNARWAARAETGVESGGYYRNGSLHVNDSGIVHVADTTFLGTSPAYLTLKYEPGTPPPARLVNPIIAEDGQFHCDLIGDPGARYTIQVSSDAAHWTPLINVEVPAAGTTRFADPTTTRSSNRFYRAARP